MFKSSCEYSVLRDDDLIILLDEYYNIKNVKSLRLHRAFIGDVYFIEDDKQSYVMKIYKSDLLHKKNAENSADVMEYLRESGITVPKVYKNKNNCNTTTIFAPEGEREVVVISFIDEKKISEEHKDEDHRMIGKQVALMRSVMKDYPYLDRLAKIDEDYIIDNFIKVMNKYFPKKEEEISFFKSYGEIISKKIKELYSKQPQCIGFCHGDFHDGNIIKTLNDEVAFFDFDACGIGCNMLDIAVYCDETNYFNLDKTQIKETQKTLEVFLEGYTKVFPLSQLERDSIPLFIALRHYELNATIPINRAPIEGSHWLNDNWLNAQYTWLKEWYEIYHK
ncbi:phosphotransferase enzyme family protein [Oceanirhabdus sp. W0125-5]|uniref:phosphotransferase enzyme family protein n=1 Tax=Oceanirhabdus sp. W0125-5 TaxID=2999116 RepID=UPI0022F33246|nr:phosphotransferase [Oceanirhabdus sp. W0125-5]WBW96003.1 phosphotransferase [Oceanirhabdus sp. W0125-5]